MEQVETPDFRIFNMGHDLCSMRPKPAILFIAQPDSLKMFGNARAEIFYRLQCLNVLFSTQRLRRHGIQGVSQHIAKQWLDTAQFGCPFVKWHVAAIEQKNKADCVFSKPASCQHGGWAITPVKGARQIVLACLRGQHSLAGQFFQPDIPGVIGKQLVAPLAENAKAILKNLAIYGCRQLEGGFVSPVKKR